MPGFRQASVVQVLLSPHWLLSEQTAQAWVLQDWEEEPEQVLPPQDGEGLVQVRSWVPPPQETLQLPQADQLPLTG